MLLDHQPRLVCEANGYSVGADPRNARSLWYEGQSHVWEKGTFETPSDTPEERVQERAYLYRNKYGKILERQGFTVLGFDGPRRDDGLVGRSYLPPDRKRYVLWAKVRRTPVEHRVTVSDAAVVGLLASGWRLVD